MKESVASASLRSLKAATRPKGVRSRDSRESVHLTNVYGALTMCQALCPVLETQQRLGHGSCSRRTWSLVGRQALTETLHKSGTTSQRSAITEENRELWEDPGGLSLARVSQPRVF